MTRLAATLLAAAVAAGAYAWQVQRGAADLLERARALQQASGQGGGSAGPELADYRAVLTTLERSVAIRRDIDRLVSRAETIVASFERSRRAALDTAAAAATELAGTAAELGAAARAARAGARVLGPLAEHLARAVRLARLIAAELAELDRSLGPKAPAPARERG